MLTCPDFPGCCKIGGTSRTASHRALELVAEYGTDTPFEVVHRLAVPAWFDVEQTAHRMLSDRRLPRSELFRVSPVDAASVIRAAAAAYVRPWGLSAWLRRRRPAMARPRGYTRRRQRTNRLPWLLGLVAVIGLVVIVQPAPPSWLPQPVARSLLLVERLRL